MALTEIYVDPAIAGNSGTGTSGDPYGDLQYALNTATRDATNGNRFNIKAGTAEVMAAAISLATYGTPTAAAPLLFQGYTSAAGDGGVGEINNGGANISVINSATLDYICFVDMKLGNTGTAQILKLDTYTVLANVEFHSSSAASAIQLAGIGGIVARCKFHSITGASMLTLPGSTEVFDSYFSYGVSSGYCINALTGGVVRRCIFNLTGSARGMTCTGTMSSIEFCVFYATSGTGFGLNMGGTNMVITNNIFTGFSGAGGKGILYSALSAGILGNNFFYNNTADISGTPIVRYRLPDVTLTNAPFTNAAGGDFSIATAAKTELQSQGWPSSLLGISTNQYLDPGAAQIQPSSGGAFAVMGGLIVR